MSRRSPLARIAVWAFAFALLLKAAVPMLASASAAVQGKALADVCSVYGVATVSLPGPSLALAVSDAHARHAHHAHHQADGAAVGTSPMSVPMPTPVSPPSHDDRHAGDHCVLTALLALAAPETLPVAMPPAASSATSLAQTPDAGRAHAPDALARWASRLRHGPPFLLS